MNIVPIITGTHRAISTDDGVSLPGHTGAVTLLRNGTENILVDVGARGTFPRIVSRLQEEGLSIDDIHVVILTHFHLDHAFNVAQFEQSKVVAWMHDWRAGETFRFNDIEDDPIVDGVSLLKTPGHAEEHLSVVVKNDDGDTIVVAGDAVNEHFARTGEIQAFTYDEALYRESARQVLGVADRIIPGHGEPFERSVWA